MNRLAFAAASTVGLSTRTLTLAALAGLEIALPDPPAVATAAAAAALTSMPVDSPESLLIGEKLPTLRDEECVFAPVLDAEEEGLPAPVAN